MSLSVGCNSDGSITFCDEAKCDDDLIEETSNESKSSKSRRRHTSFVNNEHYFETSTPRFPHHQSFGKENDFRKDRNNKQRRCKALGTIFSENQSFIQSDVKSASLEKKKRVRKNANCMTMSFEIYRQGVDEPDTEEKSFQNFGQFNTPIKEDHRFQVPVSQSSPEYEPTTFFDPINMKDEYLKETKNSFCTSENQFQQIMEIFPDLNLESEQMKAPINDVIDSILSETKNKVSTKIEDVNKTVDTKKFEIDQFLKLVPDPWTYFGDKERDCTGYIEHSLHYLKINFRKFYNQTINDALLFHNQNLYLACKYLKKKNRGLKLRMSNRPMSECNLHKPTTVNLQFELEVSFIEHEEEVKNYVKAQAAEKKFRLKEATRLGLLVECECCFGENFLREDVVTCNAGHTFCKECIVRYIEIGIRNEIGQIQCLGPCNEEYSLQFVWDILKPEMFSKLMEIFQSSDFDDLTQCPFCHNFLYLPIDVKIAKCFNVKCLKRFCRICKGPNHEPAKCEIIPVTDWCWRCNNEIKKMDGCNEMICSCGGKTCHVCGQPVKNQSHFCLYEDENNTKCPLYSTEYSGK